MAYTLVAVGDTCYKEPDARSREVSDQIMQIRPDQTLLLGDVCQGQGSEKAYRDWFDPTYGRLFNKPGRLTGIPGNHDRIADGHSRPFRKRFLGNTNINNPTYFSQKIGKSWLLIALDDNRRYIDEQNAWLRQQLKANRNGDRRQVVLAWHAPRFTIGGTSVHNNTRVARWWDMIHDDPYTRILLHGHQHSFRHKTTKKKYLRDVFIVGTGGGDKRRPRNRYGVLVLTLYDAGGFKAQYRQIFKNYNQRIGGPRGKVTAEISRGPRRVQVVNSGGAPQVTTPSLPTPEPPPPPPPPPASNPDNPPPPEPPPSSIRPPKPPKDPTKKEAYVKDDILYVWG